MKLGGCNCMKSFHCSNFFPSAGHGHFKNESLFAHAGCLPMTKCDVESKNQNITVYGILLFVSGLTFLFVGV